MQRSQWQLLLIFAVALLSGIFGALVLKPWSLAPVSPSDGGRITGPGTSTPGDSPLGKQFIESNPQATSSPTTPVPPPAQTRARPETPALQPAQPLPFDRSPLADTLNTPSTTPQQDAATVRDLLSAYRDRLHALPAAENNTQFVNALTGNNPLGIAILPPDSPAIRNGELVDRLGQPYFFHQLSSSAIEVRSPGPDKELWTPDDPIALIGPPPGN